MLAIGLQLLSAVLALAGPAGATMHSQDGECLTAGADANEWTRIIN
jgi:hypothetical protein